MWKWLALFVFLPLAALAQGLPDPLSDAVSDYDDVIDAATEARLDAALRAVRDETGVHVVLVVMQSREDWGSAGRTIESYGLALFNRWGVGDRQRNDGVMILVGVRDREMRIQLGSGFGRDWDRVAQGVIDDSFLPAFRIGQTLDGIETGTQAVIQRIARPFAAGQPAPHSPDGGGGIGALLALPLILVAALGLALRNVFADWMVSRRPCPKCGMKTLSRTRRIVDPATTVSSGSGMMTTRCANCDYLLEERYYIPRRSTSRSRGGGGFGGGRSSGGGASGRW